jgi:rhodanese-related sulfurtransferase
MQRVFMTAGVIVIVVVVLGVILAQWRRGYQTMTAEEIRAAVTVDSTIVVVDVRTPEEFRGETGHLPGALLIPLQDLERRLPELEQYKARKIIAYCRSGRRSGNAAGLLTAQGFTAINLEGGILRWRELGYPLVNESGN